MRILQVSTMDLNGGAEKVAWKLHHAFRARGHDSILVVGVKRSGDEHTIELGASSKTRPVEFLLSGEALGLQGWRHPGSRHIRELAGDPWDVIQLHNLHGRYFDLSAVGDLASHAPTILTMHDMWLLTGHCAHPLGCERWHTGCGHCPDLSIYPPVRFDLTRANLARKQRLVPARGIAISSPGEWLLSLVAESYLDAAPRRSIPNPVETSVFVPGDARRARQELGLPQDRPIALLPAQLTVPASAFRDQNLFLDALAHLSDLDILGVAFGDPRAADTAGDLVRVFPQTFDESRMALFYRAADVVVLPSHADTAPLAVLEAMSTATPVVATRVGGIPEMVVDGLTGALVDEGDLLELVGEIRRLLEDPGLRERFGSAGRERAVSRYDLDLVVDAWLTWYAELAEECGAVNRT